VNRDIISEKMSPSHRLGMRPFCYCCAGGDYRRGYTRTKSASRAANIKAKKPKYKDHR